MSDTKEVAIVAQVRTAMEQMHPQFKAALPAHVPVEKFSRVAMTAINGNPDLLKADRRTLFAACMKSAQDGLLPDGREAALVTFGNTVQYMPMVAGILKKVRQSGDLLTISAHVVYTADDFAYELGDDEHIKHIPCIDGDRGTPKLAYAIAKTKDGGIYREIMTEQQIQAVRAVSRSGKSGPWSGPFADEMRRKTVLRRLSKRLPMSTDLEDTLRTDDPLYDPASPEPEAAPAPAVPTRPRSLQAVADAAGDPMERDAIDMERDPPVDGGRPEGDVI